MRTTPLACLVSATLLLLAPTAQAQRPRLKIEQVKVGFLANPQTGEFKSGAWAPVYIDITAPPEGLPKSPSNVVQVESADTDDIRNNYTIPLPPLEPNERVSLLSYVRPGSANGEIAVHVKIGDYNPITKKENFLGMQLGNVLYVVVGSRPVGFRRALAFEHKRSQGQQQRGGPQGGDDEEDVFGKDTGPRHIAFVDDVRQLPTRWFAYEGVDILFLTTGNREFITALLNDQENRKEAIAEWVRRGGRLVLSVGRNLDLLANLPPSLQALLPAELAGKVERPQLFALKHYITGAADFQHARPRNNPNAAPPPVEIVKLVPRPAKQAVAVPGLSEEIDKVRVPLAVRGIHGLGRVWVLGFDLDLPPFANWDGQGTTKTGGFWSKFVRSELGREPAADVNPQQRWMMNQQDSNDVGSMLQRSLEDFEDVPVISFGWVALFILVYILVVGPLDYFFLKKVVKRLELTWITFPTVVIAISVAAYFTAYYLKGNDQKINKVDLLDIDLSGQEAFGQTWFTIFSPRIQHYTVGVEPSAPEWAAAKTDPDRDYSVVVTWMGRPENAWGGTGQRGSQSLFRRTYEYEPDATGLRGVPIQVWTTKSFTASWELPLDANKPLFKADLRWPKNKKELLSGTITNGLPVELEDVYLFYNKDDGGRWYFLDRLLPDDPRRIDAVLKGASRMEKEWVQGPVAGTPVRPNTPNRRNYGTAVQPAGSVIKRVLFTEAEGTNQVRNFSLRNLDQTWRRSDPEEVILFGRVAPQAGLAEEVARTTAGACRLWLGPGGPPGANRPRPILPGTLNQETYVRVFIPVRTVEQGGKE